MKLMIICCITVLALLSLGTVMTSETLFPVLAAQLSQAPG